MAVISPMPDPGIAQNLRTGASPLPDGGSDGIRERDALRAKTRATVA